ncbi:MAG: GTPase HflX, partial [Gammaproteobacteria bacterium]|nr:GTPase HflX [Gammaproteobacteria bacterium]
MFERPQSGERAVLVHSSPDGLPDSSEREEFAELAMSAGAVVVGELLTSRKRPDARYFIGKGKLEDLKSLILKDKAELVISCAS